MSKTDSAYWEGRIAKETWNTYNSLEERNRHLLEMYQDASRNISEELYNVAEKINGGKTATLSDMHKMNRLGKLKESFEGIIEDMGTKTEEFTRQNMQEGFRDTYKSASAAISGDKFTVPNKAMMDEMLDRPWHGGSFSERLWKNTSLLAANLNADLVTGLQQGKTIAEISINLANDMMQGFNVTHRLVRTETMHYLNNSALKAYKDRGIEYVEVWAAEDERTCSHCMKYHSKIYPIEKVPILPIHANCRCTVLPVVDDEIFKKYTKAIDKSDKNGIIKNIDLDDMKDLAHGKDIDSKVLKEIYKTIKPGEARGEYYIGEVFIGAIKSEGDRIALFQIEPVPAGKIAMLRLNMNSDYLTGKTIEELDYQIANSATTVANSLKDAIVHEIGHAKLINKLSIGQIEKLYSELESKGVKGLSPIAGIDGVEAIAEIEVLLSRGDKLTGEAIKLYQKYMGVKHDIPR